MHTEIGSIFEIDPDLFTHKHADAVFQLRLKEVEKYNKKHIRYTASGREAIALALKSFEEKYPGASKCCLLPAYMCDTVFFPFERAGWTIHFYHLDRDLTADITELRKLVEQVRPELIFIHSYYGVDTWKSARSFFHEWKMQGICIMEDVTQSYYLENAGKEANFCVGSLRKWYAIPDGGFVTSDEILSEEEPDSNEEFVRTRLELLTEKWEYLYEQGNIDERQSLKKDYLKKNKEMEAWLDSYAGIASISDKSSYILSLTDENKCKNKRMENCRYLQEKLIGKKQFVPVFNLIFDFAPLYFPIYVQKRDGLQNYLSAHDIYAPVLWPVGKENADYLSQEERYIYEHILALPIDQRYGLEEMQQIVKTLEQYEEWKAENTTQIKATHTKVTQVKATQVQEAQMREVQPKEPQIIGIRTDANDTIATGHVMRCITIAKQIASTGCEVIFFTADDYAEELISQAGMRYICLHTDWDHMEEEVALLRTEIKKAGCKKLLVDSYQVTREYFSALSDLCKIIYIDDCFEDIYPVDMVINYNAYHVRFPYDEAYAERTKLLLGTSYVPLREEFSSMSNSHVTEDHVASELLITGPAANEVRILLSSGGGDLCNALTGILGEAVHDQELQNVIFDVVVGSFNRNAEELERQAKAYPNIRLHDHVDHMAELMRQCTAAVSAAGTMLFELSATQIPTVFFVSADNQQYDHEFFAAEERMLYAGDIRKNREKCLKEICSGLKRILKDADMRNRMRRKRHEVTDGRGAFRIAEEIIRL